MLKTPVSALVDIPDKKFLYEYNAERQWEFFVELIGVDREIDENKNYPF